jgi:hypothetical protein
MEDSASLNAGHFHKIQTNHLGSSMADRRSLSLVDMQKLADSRGGECTTNEYINSSTKMGWRCSEGHEWEAPAKSIQDGRWCRKCGRKATASKLTKTIEDMKKLAAAHGGECLSDSYENYKSKLRWRCAAGHEWESVPANIKIGYRCRVCAIDKRKEKEGTPNALSILCGRN